MSEILQILSVSLFEKTPIFEALSLEKPGLTIPQVITNCRSSTYNRTVLIQNPKFRIRNRQGSGKRARNRGCFAYYSFAKGPDGLGASRAARESRQKRASGSRRCARANSARRRYRAAGLTLHDHQTFRSSSAQNQSGRVGLGAVVAAVHAAFGGRAVANSQHVPRLVCGDLQGPAQAGRQVGVRVALAIERPDADAVLERGLAEDEVPALAGPEVRRRQGQHRNRVVGTLLLEQVENVRGEDLSVTPGGMDPPGPLRDPVERYRCCGLHRHPVEPAEKVGGRRQQLGLGSIERTQRLEIRRGVPNIGPVRILPR